jgi:hypothetical protein
MKTPTPSDMCSGSCGGKRENCPVPMACGWPEYDKSTNEVLRVLLALIIIAGLVIFFLGLMVWP